MTALRFEKQSQWLRQRYYQNMTVLDALSKAFGELGWLKQSILFIVSLSPVCFFYISPAFLVMGCLVGGFLLLLRAQYHALEHRFKLLIEDMTYLEKELEQLMLDNHDLEKKIIKGFEENELVAQQLEKERMQMSNMQEKCIEDQQKIQVACEGLIDSASKIGDVTADFIVSVVGSLDKAKQFMLTVDETLILFQTMSHSKEEFLQAEKINAIIAFRKAAEEDLIKSFGAKYQNFSKAYDENICPRKL